MKPLFILTLFILLSVSHADVSVIDDANNLPITTSSSDDADPKIRLPTETAPATELTQSSPQNTEVHFDLTDLMNRRPVHYNRFILPFIRHRCRHHNHNHLLTRYQLASIMKRNAEIIAHRHVALSAEGGEKKVAQFEQSFIPLPHLHHLRFGHDHVVDRTAEVRREKEGGDEVEEKQEYLVDENQVDEEHPHRRHHHHHHHHHDDQDSEEEVEEKEEYKVKENDEEEEHRHHHHHHWFRREHDDEDEQKEVKREDADEERHLRLRHRHHRHHHDHDDHDEEEHEKKHGHKRNDIVSKIRKFLLHF